MMSTGPLFGCSAPCGELCVADGARAHSAVRTAWVDQHSGRKVLAESRNRLNREPRTVNPEPEPGTPNLNPELRT
jgi:hypothetical protein